MRKLAIGLAAALVLIVAALAGMIAFGTAATPPHLESISAPFRSVDYSDLPQPESIIARDGIKLAYRVYRPSSPAGAPVVIAIHGSSASSSALHVLGKALQREGITMYAPDVRGHGGSGTRGDIEAAGRLDDDLADVTAMVRARHPQSPLVLLGFSSGAGFALHAAALRDAPAFDRGVLVSPMLGPRAPTVRPTGDRWAAAYIPRIVALLVLERLGLHAFEGLPALAFAVAPGNPADLTERYSFRLMRAFGTRDYVADLRTARFPLTIIVGARDELFDATKFAPTVQAVRTDVPVIVVPNLNHIEMTTDPRAIPAVVAAIRG